MQECLALVISKAVDMRKASPRLTNTPGGEKDPCTPHTILIGRGGKTRPSNTKSQVTGVVSG